MPFFGNGYQGNEARVVRLAPTSGVFTRENKNMTEPETSWQLLPPSPEYCQVCAVKHPPEQPHDRQSLFYQTKFNLEHGRAPTWADAMSHCAEPVKEAWQRELKDSGHWDEPAEVCDPDLISATIAVVEVEALLMLVLENPPSTEQLSALPPEQLDQLFAWAAREHLVASDCDAERLPEPECLAPLLNSGSSEELLAANERAIDPFSFEALRAALQPALEFPDLPEPDEEGIARVAGNEGKAAIEVSPNNTCLFVQNYGISNAELVRNGAGLLQLLTHFFPSWAKSKKWLDSSLASKRSEEQFAREGKLINLRKTRAGIFLTVSGPEANR